MRAATVCVDFSDTFAEALAYNRHHFDEYLVVTSPADKRTQKIAEANDCQLHITDAFYADGALFNKYRALEGGLDAFGRHDWMCILDADIFTPKAWPEFEMHIGHIYGPHRRMVDSMPVPDESQWESLPSCRNVLELSGYFHLFHASDPFLPEGHWYQTDWKHAGGADTFFQQRWPAQNRIRPPFLVVHAGEQGKHWCGVGNERSLQRMMQTRRKQKNFNHERIR